MWHIASNLLTILSTGDGVTWVIQALNAQLILATLRCSDTALVEGRKIHADITIFLSGVLPQYLVYELVLIAAGRAVRRSRHFEETLEISEPLRGCWTAFQADVLHGLALSSQYHPDGVLDLRRGCSLENVSHFGLDYIIKLTPD